MQQFITVANAENLIFVINSRILAENIRKITVFPAISFRTSPKSTKFPVISSLKPQMSPFPLKRYVRPTPRLPPQSSPLLHSLPPPPHPPIPLSTYYLLPQSPPFHTFASIEVVDIEDGQFTLENGLTVTVVSDKTALLSYAQVVVYTGSMSEEYRGLAHFVEHAVFINSEKYPEEGLMLTVAVENGGLVNAMTGPEFTVFMCETKPAAFNQTLDMFSGMLTSPQFPEPRLSSEILAVNSEHERNMHDDYWRLHRLTQLLAAPSHPYSRFNTGSSTTLGLITNLTTTVRSFFNTFYVGGNMELVLIGNHSVVELTNIAETQFGTVRNGQREVSFRSSPVFPSTNKVVLGQLVGRGEWLTVLWAVPTNGEGKEGFPSLSFIAYLLTVPGNGGVRDKLMGENLVLDLDAMVYLSLDDVTIFIIFLELTDYGFVHWENCLSLLFSYLDFVKTLSQSKISTAYSQFLANSRSNINQKQQKRKNPFKKTAFSEKIPLFPEKTAGKPTIFPENVNFYSTQTYLNTINKQNSIGIFMSNRWNETEFMGKAVNFSNYEENYEMHYEIYDMPNFEPNDAEFSVTWPDEISNRVPTNCKNCSHAPVLVHNTTALSLHYSVTFHPVRSRLQSPHSSVIPPNPRSLQVSSPG